MWKARCAPLIAGFLCCLSHTTPYFIYIQGQFQSLSYFMCQQHVVQFFTPSCLRHPLWASRAPYSPELPLTSLIAPSQSSLLIPSLSFQLLNVRVYWDSALDPFLGLGIFLTLNLPIYWFLNFKSPAQIYWTPDLCTTYSPSLLGI